MKTINFKYDDVAYTLCFTKRTVQQLEASGFNIQSIDGKMATSIPLLFAGAFKAKHPFVKQAKIDEIYAALTNKADLISALVDCYSETLEGLLAEPEEGKGNAVAWTTTE